MEKVVQDNSGAEFAERITAMESDLCGLISMKLHKEIDDEAYNREYHRLNREFTDLRMKKDEIDKTKLQKTKDISRITAVKDIIGDGTKSLSEFDDELVRGNG